MVARAYSIASATFSTSTQLQANAATATILADLRLDADTVAAALLYNALDASPLTRDQLSKLLPPTVADMVAATSRITDTCTALQADQTAKVGSCSLTIGPAWWHHQPVSTSIDTHNVAIALVWTRDC